MNRVKADEVSGTLTDDVAKTDEEMEQVFAQLEDLEKQFNDSELESFRRKEFALKPLYEKRKSLTQRIPEFWPQVFANPPEEVEKCLTESDLAVLGYLKSIFIERHQIESDTAGDPRGIRFTFDFLENPFFEDTTLVKEFHHQSTNKGSEGLVSTPVAIKWKKGNKCDVTGGLLDAAVELYQAEQTLTAGKKNVVVDRVERESLWQHEKLGEKLDAIPDERPSFFNWFGYRGAIPNKTEVVNNDKENDEMDASDVEEEDGRDLDVEIFPGGDEIAIALAEDLWPNVMDYFMASQVDPEVEEWDPDDEFDPEAMDAGDSSQEEAPELVSKEESEDEKRPEKRKRQN